MPAEVKISDSELIRAEKALDELGLTVKELEKKYGHKPRACVVTFGCQMNARDSEKLSGVLEKSGFVLTDDEYGADFVVFNTCTVRENADNHLYGRLGRLSQTKRERPALKIAICGCMMQEKTAVEKLKTSYPYVSLIFGTFNIHRFAELLVSMYSSDRMIVDIWHEASEVTEDLPAVRKYPFKSGVNIMYGCDNFCSYCIVPFVRGRERSRKKDGILSEVKKLALDGVKEVMLLGQNVNSYGHGLDENVNFPELLRSVCETDGIERVRFMSSHPKDLSDDLIEVMRTEKKVARHIHLAMQSGSDRILKLMNRHYTKADFLNIVNKIHEADPDICITTDIIVGFPTETGFDVSDTVSAVREACFDNAFTFIYSKRSGTPAAGLEDTADKDEIKRNFDRVLEAVKETSSLRAKRFENKIESVLVEEVNAKDSSFLSGRLSGNALVHFEGDKNLIGSFVNVMIDEAHGFYFKGHRV